MKRRRLDFDLLRILSMFGVIYLHVASGALRTLEHKPLWAFSNALTAFATPAVPLFLMISGALLLRDEKTESLPYLFRHRLPRLVVPLCAWSALIILYSVVNQNYARAYELSTHFLSTPVVVPYWFLYALIPICLLSPLLKKLTDHLDETGWRYLVGLWGAATLGLNSIRIFLPADYQHLLAVHWSLNVDLVGGYLGYFLLGAYLDRLERLPSRKALSAALAALVVLSMGGTAWDSYAHMAYSDRFTNYLTLLTMLLSAVIFLLFRSAFKGREARGKLIPLLSGVSFGVYMAHPLVIGVWEKIWAAAGWAEPVTIPQQLLFYALVALCCVAGNLLLSSIPGVCYLFTGQTYRQACRASNLQALFAPGKEKSD